MMNQNQAAVDALREPAVRPLPKTQADLLDAMRSGVTLYFMPYMGTFNPNEYYFKVGTLEKREFHLAQAGEPVLVAPNV